MPVAHWHQLPVPVTELERSEAATVIIQSAYRDRTTATSTPVVLTPSRRVTTNQAAAERPVRGGPRGPLLVRAGPGAGQEVLYFGMAARRPRAGAQRCRPRGSASRSRKRESGSHDLNLTRTSLCDIIGPSSVAAGMALMMSTVAAAALQAVAGHSGSVA